MRNWMLTALALLLAGTLAWPAGAWGPSTQNAIVTTALHLISKEANIPLDRLQKDLQAGASLSMDMVSKLYPFLASSAIGAIESEMILLQAVQGDRVDPYFAYRLGVLGKLVAEVTAPLAEAEIRYRNLYYADVEGQIRNVALKSSPRQVVDPPIYLPRVIAEAASRDDVIEREYQDGTGFEGVARALLPQDASRSVNAVADVWFTILSGRGPKGNVSDSQLRRYVEEAYSFYIARENTAEIEAVSPRLDALTPKTPDLQVRIGDMFFDAKLFDRAMDEYRAVLRAAPDRRDVVEKMSAYYVDLGDKALENNRLEEALDAFREALQVNPLHPTAEAQRLTAEGLITARDARLSTNRASIERAQQFETLAEQEALKNRYAEAIALLRQAGAAYDEVTDEFPAEHQRRMRGMNNLRFRIDELKKEIMANAQVFSGTGFVLDARNLARRGDPGLSEEALKTLVRREFENEMKKLEERMAPALAVR